MLRWNPHFHAILLEGGFDAEGSFVYLPFSGLEKMTEYFRRIVVRFFTARNLITEHFARNLLSWRHSGVSTDYSVRILDESSRENLAQYMARPPISLKKTHYEGFKGKVLFHTHYRQWSITTRAGPCFSKLIFAFSRIGRGAGCVLLPGACRSFLVYFSRFFRFEGL